MTLTVKNNRIVLYSQFEQKDRIKALPNARWDKAQRAWIFPLDQEHWDLIQSEFPEVNADGQIFQKWKNELWQLEEVKAERISLFFDQLLKTSLRDYQRIGASFLVFGKQVFLTDAMGIGKTLQAIAASLSLKHQGLAKKCLIVCPNSVKEPVWKRQVELHTNEQIIVIEGEKRKRLEQLQRWNEQPIFFCVMNYEAIRDHEFFEFLKPDIIIGDESIKLKNPKAAQTKAMKSIPSKYRFALSGYPISNSPEDLWSQFDWLRPGYLGSYWKFQDQYMIVQKRELPNHSFREIIGYRHLDQLRKRIDPFVLRRLKSEVLDLPPKIYETREVELTVQQRQVYDEARREIEVFIRDLSDEELRLKTELVIVKLLRLSQIVDGFVNDTDWVAPKFFDRNPKREELDDLIDETMASGESIVIWGRFAVLIHQLVTYYRGKYSIDEIIEISGRVPQEQRSADIARFQAGEAKICLGQIQTGGLGIELSAASTEVFIDKAMISVSDIQQAEDRCHRLGITKPVTIISLIAKNSIDAKWERLLKKKQNLAAQLFDMDTSIGPLKKEDLEELVDEDGRMSQP